MGDGLSAGDNTRAAVITRGLAELTRLGMALGGQALTFAGLAGMGDLVATCTSPQSRNRYVGERLGRGEALNDIIAQMKMVAEGVKSVPAVMELAADLGIEMPITHEVHRVLYEGGTPRQAFRGLLRRESGAESDPA
jgi:glycerol-3-phosphate dehydrogenase (NAD(P)+)